jgi:hypothetical protein
MNPIFIFPIRKIGVFIEMDKEIRNKPESKEYSQKIMRSSPEKKNNRWTG